MDWKPLDLGKGAPVIPGVWTTNSRPVGHDTERAFAVVAAPPRGWLPVAFDIGGGEAASGWDGIGRFLVLGPPEGTRGAAQAVCERWSTTAWADSPPAGMEPVDSFEQFVLDHPLTPEGHE